MLLPAESLRITQYIAPIFMTFSTPAIASDRTETIMNSAKTEQRKETAQTWFEALRDRLVTALEGVEDALPAGAPLSDRPAGRFKRTAWQRTDHTGGKL